MQYSYVAWIDVIGSFSMFAFSLYMAHFEQISMINQLALNTSNSLLIFVNPNNFHFFEAVGSSFFHWSDFFYIGVTKSNFCPVTFPESFRFEELHVNFRVFLKSWQDTSRLDIEIIESKFVWKCYPPIQIREPSKDTSKRLEMFFRIFRKSICFRSQLSRLPVSCQDFINF